MGFIDENLIHGEKVIYKAEVHWMIYFPPIAYGAIAIFAVFFGRVALHSQSRMLPMLGTIMLLVAAYKFLQAYIHRNYTEIGITTSRLIAKFGFIRRESIELPLVRIESVLVEQSVMERLINAGSVAASGTGSALAPVRYIDNPIKFRNELNQAIATAKQAN